MCQTGRSNSLVDHGRLMNEINECCSIDENERTKGKEKKKEKEKMSQRKVISSPFNFHFDVREKEIFTKGEKRDPVMLRCFFTFIFIMKDRDSILLWWFSQLVMKHQVRRRARERERERKKRESESD